MKEYDKNNYIISNLNSYNIKATEKLPQISALKYLVNMFLMNTNYFYLM